MTFLASFDLTVAIGNLHDVEQRGDARRDILARCRRRSEERIVAFHQLRDDRRDGLGELVLERRSIGDMDLGHSGNPRRRLRDSVGVVADDQRMDFAEL